MGATVVVHDVDISRIQIIFGIRIYFYLIRCDRRIWKVVEHEWIR